MAGSPQLALCRVFVTYRPVKLSTHNGLSMLMVLMWALVVDFNKALCQLIVLARTAFQWFASLAGAVVVSAFQTSA